VPRDEIEHRVHVVVRDEEHPPLRLLLVVLRDLLPDEQPERRLPRPLLAEDDRGVRAVERPDHLVELRVCALRLEDEPLVDRVVPRLLRAEGVLDDAMVREEVGRVHQSDYLS
jgi:hypothetical protein